MAYGREGRNVEFKVRVMSQTLIDSQVHVIQVHKYCTIKCETFRFALATENLKKMKEEPDLSLVRDDFSIR